MASSFPGTINPAAILFPAATRELDYSAVYSEHCHRIYSLSFWMTGNELLAEELAKSTFLRVFSTDRIPERDYVDQAFLAELRESFAIGNLTVSVTPSPLARSMRSNIKRAVLEHAVVQVPPTEKLIFLLHDVESYSHDAIARLLGIGEDESRSALHQARLLIRELVSAES